MTLLVLVPTPAARATSPAAFAAESCDAAAKVLLEAVLAPVANVDMPESPAATAPVVTSMMPVLAELEIVVRAPVPVDTPDAVPDITVVVEIPVLAPARAMIALPAPPFAASDSTDKVRIPVVADPVVKDTRPAAE